MTDVSAVELAAELTVAWLSNPSTRASVDEVDAFLVSMNKAVAGLAQPSAGSEEQETPAPAYTPAVSVRKSLASRDHIISMIDGRPYRTLKRHLAGYGLTPAEYRSRYNLKADYPMVAPGYSEMRRETSKRLGLGRKVGGSPAAASAAAAEPKADVPVAPRRRARKGSEGTVQPLADGAAAAAAAALRSAPADEQKRDAKRAATRARKSASEAKEAAKRHLGG